MRLKHRDIALVRQSITAEASNTPSFCLQEEQNRGKPNWEHLSDELHVLITVEDSENRAAAKLQRAVDEIKKLLVPSVSGFSAHA